MRRTATVARALVLALAAAAGACGGLDVNENRATAVALVADPQVAEAGQTVTFHVEAEGMDLVGVELAYGDGTADSLNALGAQTAASSFEHAYATPAEYEAVATVFEISGRSSGDTAVVLVTAPGG